MTDLRDFSPPYFVVIFSSRRTSNEDAGYAAMAARMEELAAQQPGFLGIESVRNAQGQGITLSYWRDEASIADWRAHAEHQLAQRLGREQWYAQFWLRVCEVRRAWEFQRPE